MRAKPTVRGSAAMIAKKRKKLEVWFEAEDFAKLVELAGTKGVPVAKLARAIIREILHNTPAARIFLDNIRRYR